MTKMILQSRDKQIVEFLKEFHIADTTTLARLFFNGSTQSCSKRLLKLYNNGYLNKWRNSVIEPYLYYLHSKPKNYKHSLIISDIYSRIATEYQVLKVKREMEIKYRNKEIRTDLMCVIKLNNKVVPILFEMDLTKAYSNKYTDYISSGYWKMLFGEKPIVCVIGNRTPKSSIPIQWIKLSELS